MNSVVNPSKTPSENWLAVAHDFLEKGDYQRALEAVDIVAAFQDPTCQNNYHALFFKASLAQLLANNQTADAARLLTRRIREVRGPEKAALQQSLAQLIPSYKHKRKR